MFDAQGRVVKTILPDGSSTQTEYDAYGRVSAEIDALNQRRDLQYDASGRLSQVQLPAVPDPLNNNVSTRPTYLYEYNAQGQMTKLTDALGHITTFGFNSQSQPTSRTLPSTVSESFSYDARGREILHVSFEGVHRRTVYDDTATGGGRVLRVELFATAANYTAFMNGGAANGNLANGVLWERISHTYDAFGRVVATTHVYANGATTGNPTIEVTTDSWTYAFDAEGRLTQESSPSGVVGYEYSALGRLTRTWAGNPGATASTALSDVTYTYDLLGRLATVNTVKRDGAVLDTNPGMTGNQPETSTLHYDLLGRPDYSELPNSVVEDFTFDNLDRLDVMRQYVSDADNANLTDNAIRALYDYTYRADGKRTALSETFQLTPSGQRTTDYGWDYDAAGRLTSETLDSSDNTLDQTESYILDLVGNRLRRTIDKANPADDRTDVVTLDTSDRLLTEQRYANLTGTGTPIQTTTYTWNGTQQASKAVAIPSTSTVTQTMSYGLTGQLERVITETKNGSNVVTARTQVEYRYDASGLRFVAVDSSDNNLGTSGIERVENGRTEYLLDHHNATGYGQTLIETVKNAAGQTTQRTSFTFGADEITQTVTTFNPSTGVVTATATHAFGHDGHGSVRVLFDAAAAVNQVFTYSAYGEFLAIHNGAGLRTSGNAAALANPGDALTKQLYNGENLDPRTGLYNFRARWYAASSGRFERLDPYAGNFGDPQSLHKYLYGHADAVNSIDPNGQWSLGQTMMATTIGGAIAGFSYGVYRAGEETGWELSWKSVTKGLVYGVVGGLIGAGAGALAGLAFHSLIVLPLQGVAAGTVGTGASWTSLLGHFVALAHPTVTVFFGLGFTVGMSLGIASPTSVIAAFSALLLGQTSLEATVAYQRWYTLLDQSLPVLRTEAPALWEFILGHSYFSNPMSGRAVTPFTAARTGALWTGWFTMGLAAGFVTGVFARPLLDYSLDVVGQLIPDD